MNDVASTRLVTVKRPLVGFNGPMTVDQFGEALEALELAGWIRVAFMPALPTHDAAVEVLRSSRDAFARLLALPLDTIAAMLEGAERRVIHVSQPEEPAEVLSFVDPSEFEIVDDHTVRPKPRGEPMADKSITERVLTAVKAGANTTAAVARELGVNGYTATNAVDELLDEGLLVSRGVARGRRIYVRGHEPKPAPIAAKPEPTPAPRRSARDRPVKREPAPRMDRVAAMLEQAIAAIDRECAELEEIRDTLTTKREEKRALEGALAALAVLTTKPESTS